MEALNLNLLKKEVPSAFAMNHNMSESYKQVHTHELINKFADLGYVVVGGQQPKVRRRNPTQVKHLLRLAQADLLDKNLPEMPQILLLNSHNGRTKCRLFAGVYRFVCLNGMVVGTDNARVELRHQGDIEQQLEEAVQKIRGETEKAIEGITVWSKIHLKKGAAENLAQAALEARFGKEDAKKFEPASLLVPERPQDKGDDLWRVFNRIQEHIINGGPEGKASTGRVIKMLPLKELEKQTEVNQVIWSQAASLAA